MSSLPTNNSTHHPLDWVIRGIDGLTIFLLFFGFMIALVLAVFGVPLNILSYGADASGMTPMIVAAVVGVLLMIVYPAFLRMRYPLHLGDSYRLGILVTPLATLILAAGASGFVFALWLLVYMFGTFDNTSLVEFLSYPNFIMRIIFIAVILRGYVSLLRRFISPAMTPGAIVFSVVSICVLLGIWAELIFARELIEPADHSWMQFAIDICSGSSVYTYFLWQLWSARPYQPTHALNEENGMINR